MPSQPPSFERPSAAHSRIDRAPAMRARHRPFLISGALLTLLACTMVPTAAVPYTADDSARSVHASGEAVEAVVVDAVLRRSGCTPVSAGVDVPGATVIRLDEPCGRRCPYATIPGVA
jgi:hypothetical protein